MQTNSKNREAIWTKRELAAMLTGLRGDRLCLPNGARLQVSRGGAGLAGGEPSTAFPSFATIAHSFDAELARRMGEELSGVCREAGVQALLLSNMEDMQEELQRAFLDGLAGTGTGAILLGNAPVARGREDALAALAVDDAAGATAALNAGCDLVLSGDPSALARSLEQAIEEGTLSLERARQAAARVAAFAERFGRAREQDPDFFPGSSHHFSRRAARASAVLLKNDGALPLRPSEKVAFIGAFALEPPCLAFGPDRVSPLDQDGALFSARSVARVSFAQGCRAGQEDAALAAEAVSCAREADKVVLFLGRPDTEPARAGMPLPDEQLSLLEAVLDACPSVSVVLYAGAPMYLPWLDRVQAALWMGLGGEAVGGATVDLLFGAVSPCGRLATGGAQGAFPPPGTGLSYTTFHLAEPIVDDGSVSVDVTNTGRRAADRVVQLYRGDTLCAFRKLSLSPGQTVRAVFPAGETQTKGPAEAYRVR